MTLARHTDRIESERLAGSNRRISQELGYTFDRNYWGLGYAIQAAAQVFEYASAMPFRRIVSVIDHDKVTKRLGARQENSTLQMGIA